jgi:hypothetical protein
MDADDFQDLYKLLRGSRCATAVLDARALFVERKLELALLELTEARASFAESRHRVLRQDPEKTIDAKAKDRDRQIKKAKRKQEKAQETLDAFDELLPVLTKMAQRELSRKERQSGAEQSETTAEDPLARPTSAEVSKEAAPGRDDAGRDDAGRDDAGRDDAGRDDAGLDSYSDFDSIGEGPLPNATNEVYSDGSHGPQRPASKADFTSRFLKEFAVCRGDAKLDVVGGSFGFRPVENELDVVGDAVYLIQTSKRTMLVSLSIDSCEDDELRLFDLVAGKRVKPIPRVAFLDLGLRHKMVLLTCAESGQRQPLVSARDSDLSRTENAAGLGSGETVVDDHGTEMNDPSTVVDD